MNPRWPQPRPPVPLPAFYRLRQTRQQQLRTGRTAGSPGTPLDGARGTEPEQSPSERLGGVNFIVVRENREDVIYPLTNRSLLSHPRSVIVKLNA